MRGAVLLGGLMLAACGGDKDTTTVTSNDGGKMTITSDRTGSAATITATDASGTTATQVTGPGATWPADAPAFAPAYPGGTVAMSMGGTSADGTGAMVSFTTTDTPERVVAFYQAKAKAAGLAKVSTMTAGDARMFGAKDEASGLSLSVQASLREGKTDAAVTYAKSKG